MSSKAGEPKNAGIHPQAYDCNIHRLVARYKKSVRLSQLTISTNVATYRFRLSNYGRRLHGASLLAKSVGEEHLGGNKPNGESACAVIQTLLLALQHGAK